MKNRSTNVVEIEVYTECMEDAVYVYADIHGHREEMARFLFPKIYNLSDAQLRKITRLATTAVSDTLSGWAGLIDRPYKMPYKAQKAVTRYVSHVLGSTSHEKMLFECMQVTCPENTSAICIDNEDGWLVSAENVATALQIFTWHSHRFYKSLEKVRKQIPPF